MRRTENFDCQEYIEFFDWFANPFTKYFLQKIQIFTDRGFKPSNKYPDVQQT